MLKYNPKLRYTAQEALNHPWIQHNAYTIPLRKSIFINLTSFSSKSRFRHAIMTFIVTRMLSKNDSTDLMKAFQSLDQDCNGIITRDELIVGYQKIYGDLPEDEVAKIVDELLEKVDINEEGAVNFTEFLVAAANRDKLLHKKQIQKVFKIFDDDNNGFIEWNELKSTLAGVNISDDEYRMLIIQYDKNGDGKVFDSLTVLDLL